MSGFKTVFVVVSAGVVGAACAHRTSPATQSVIKAFDPAASDKQALDLVDQAFTACGGANWEKAKEIIWTQGFVLNGELKNVVHHSWDRWNGRHQLLRVDHNGGQGILMQDLFADKATGEVIPAGKKVPAMASKEETSKMKAEATTAFDRDAYPLTMCFKLKDPGVHVKFVESRAQLDGGGSSQPTDQKFDVIAVTFDPGVGPSAGDKYWVVFDRATHLIARVEKQDQGKGENERSAFDWKDWQEVKGLKFAMTREEVGSTTADAKPQAIEVPDYWKTLLPSVSDKPNPGNFIIYSGITINGEPDDSLYEPDIGGATLQ